MMKVLHVIGSMNPIYGGPCQGVRNLASASGKFNVEREVLCLDDPASDFINKESFPIYAIGPRKGVWWYCSKLIPWLTNNARKYDVIVINGLWLYLSFAVWKVMKLLKNQSKLENIKVPRFFVMPHGMLDPYFQLASNRKLKAIRNSIYWRLIEHRVVNEVDGVLFTCEEELQLAKQSFDSYRPKQEINIGYGIAPPPAFSPILTDAFFKICPGLNGQPYLLFLSRINYKKGVDLLIKVYQNILSKNPDIPKLVIAGPGLDSEYGQEIMQLVDSHLLNKNIFFPGLLMGDAKWGAIYGSEVFILPSHQENFGIAVVEALACNVPVLISNKVNIWREIEMNQGGIIFPNSIEGLQSTLERWISLTDAQKRLIKTNAKRTYESQFAIEPVVDRFVDAVGV